ncbi:MAG: hypothetical protein ABI748_10520 [Dokdonella sp.]
MLPGMVMGAGTNNAVKIPHYAASLSPAQRGASIATFVRKWGPYAQNMYGVDVRTWSSRLVGQFAHGDATNIQRSLARTTFEGAMAELAGVGHRSTDAQVISKLASPSSVRVGPTSDLLGDTTNDLVFTPIAPCRIADTRNAGGQIAADSNRGFNAWGVTDYLAFGGSGTDCGLASEHPSAVVLNVTAVLPATAGYATVYAGDLASPPFVSNINYAAGAIVNNNVVVALNSTGTDPDYRIYTLRASHYVVDIVGYYDNPHATPLDTTNTIASGTVVNGDDGFVAYAACPDTYVRTGGYCYGAQYQPNAFLLETGANGCVYRNNTGADITITSVGTCARVPGR